MDSLNSKTEALPLKPATLLHSCETLSQTHTDDSIVITPENAARFASEDVWKVQAVFGASFADATALAAKNTILQASIKDQLYTSPLCPTEPLNPFHIIDRFDTRPNPTNPRRLEYITNLIKLNHVRAKKLLAAHIGKGQNTVFNKWQKGDYSKLSEIGDIDFVIFVLTLTGNDVSLVNIRRHPTEPEHNAHQYVVRRLKHATTGLHFLFLFDDSNFHSIHMTAVGLPNLRGLTPTTCTPIKGLFHKCLEYDQYWNETEYAQSTIPPTPSGSVYDDSSSEMSTRTDILTLENLAKHNEIPPTDPKTVGELWREVKPVLDAPYESRWAGTPSAEARAIFAELPGDQPSMTGMSELMSAVTEIWDKVPSLANSVQTLDTQIRRTFISSITNSVVGIISTAVVYMGEDELSTSSRLALGVNLGAAITNAAITINAACQINNIKYNLSGVLNNIDSIVSFTIGTPSAPSSASELDKDSIKSAYHTATAHDAKSYINFAVRALVGLVSMGLIATGVTSMKDVIELSRFKQAITHLSTEGTDFVCFLSKLCFDYDLENISPLQTNYSGISILAGDHIARPLSAYAVHPENVVDLHRVAALIDTTLKAPLTTEQQKATSNVRGLLAAQRPQIFKKIEDVKAAVTAKVRQETIGLCLDGSRGIGKTHLATYISKRISHIMGYNDDIYRIGTVSNKFYPVYLNQRTATRDEFLAMRNDDFVSHLNTMCSIEPFNMEGADLSLKHQPCEIAHLVVCSNAGRPDIAGMNDEAQRAVWDRLQMYHIADPLVNRGRDAEYHHRQEDCSHLIIHKYANYLTPEDREVIDRTRQVTVDEIVRNQVRRVILAEEAYLNRLEVETRATEEWRARMARLQELKIEYPNPNEVQANSDEAGQDFFVVRFQGQSRTGKTEAATTMATHFSQLLAIPWMLLKNLDDFKYVAQTKTIFIVHDLVDDTNIQQYINFVNAQPSGCLFFLGSNEIVHLNQGGRYNYWRFAGKFTKLMAPPDCAYYVDKYHGVQEGALRRIGLGGIIYQNNTVCFNDPAYNMNFTFKKGYKYHCEDNQREFSLSNMEREIWTNYIKFLTEKEKFIIVREPCPYAFEPDVMIVTQSFEALKHALKNVTNVVRASSGTDPQAKIVLSTRAKDRLYHKMSISDWTVDSSSGNNTEEVANGLMKHLLDFMPDVQVKIDTRDMAVHFYQGVLYITGAEERLEKIEIQEDQIIIQVMDDVVAVSKDEVAQFIATRNPNLPIASQPPRILMALTNWYNTHMHEPSLASIKARVVVNQERHTLEYSTVGVMMRKAWDSHPILTTLGLLAGTLATSYLVYKGVQMFVRLFKSGSTPEEVSANAHKRKKGAGKFQDESYTDDDDGRLNMIKDARNNPEAMARVTRRLIGKGHHKLLNEFHQGAFVEADDGIWRRINPKGNIDEQIRRTAGPSWKSARESYRQMFGNSIVSKDVIPRPIEAILTTIEVFAEKDPEFAKEYLRKLREHDMGDLIDLYLGPLETSMLQKEAKIQANMLSVKAIPLQHNAEIERFAKQIQDDHMWIVESCAKGGRTFCVSLGANRWMAQSHMFYRVGDMAKIYNDKDTRISFVVYLDRRRDVAILQTHPTYTTNAKCIPAMKSVKPRCIKAADMENISKGYFVRYGVNATLMHAGAIAFHEKHFESLTDSTNPEFCPSEHLTKFSTGVFKSQGEAFHAGDCGSPLVAIVNGSARVCGLHIAGSGRSVGWFTSMTQEDVDFYLRVEMDEEEDIKCNAMDLVLKNAEVYELSCHPIIEGCEIPPMMTLPWEMKVVNTGLEHRCPAVGFPRMPAIGYVPWLKSHGTLKHSKRKLEIEGLETVCETELCPLTIKDVKYPEEVVQLKDGTRHLLWNQAIKYSNRFGTECDPDAEALAELYTIQHYKQLFGEVRELTLREAIEGVINPRDPLSDVMGAIDVTTSPGAYFTDSYGLIDKKKIFDIQEHQNAPTRVWFAGNVFGTDCHQRCLMQLAALSKGMPILTITKDCHKIEALPLAKTEIGQIRLFNNMDMCLNLLLKMKFGGMQGQMMLTRQYGDCQIGVNPYRDFNLLGKRLERPGFVKGNYDVKRWDKNMRRERMMAAQRIVTAIKRVDGLSREQMEKEDKALMESVVTRYTVCDGILYIAANGLPSGLYGTTAFGSIIQKNIATYAIIQQYKKMNGHFPTYWQVCSFHDFISYSDDGYYIVKEELFLTPEQQKNLTYDEKKEELFKMLHTAYDHFGLELTLGDKVHGKEDLFISRAFAWCEEESVYFASLKVPSISSAMFYYTNLSPEQMASNLNGVLFEASMHDRPIYDTFERDICKIIAQSAFPGTLRELVNFEPYEVRRALVGQYVRGELELTETGLTVGPKPRDVIETSDISDFIAKQLHGITTSNRLRIEHLALTETNDVHVSTSERPAFANPKSPNHDAFAARLRSSGIKGTSPGIKKSMDHLSKLPRDQKAKLALNQDHHHEALPKDGKTYPHWHACEGCGNSFMHAHKRRTYEESVRYKHVCSLCNKRNLEAIRVAKLRLDDSQAVPNSDTRANMLYDHEMHIYERMLPETDDINFTGLLQEFLAVGEYKSKVGLVYKHTQTGPQHRPTFRGELYYDEPTKLTTAIGTTSRQARNYASRTMLLNLIQINFPIRQNAVIAQLQGRCNHLDTNEIACWIRLWRSKEGVPFETLLRTFYAELQDACKCKLTPTDIAKEMASSIPAEPEPPSRNEMKKFMACAYEVFRDKVSVLRKGTFRLDLVSPWGTKAELLANTTAWDIQGQECRIDSDKRVYHLDNPFLFAPIPVVWDIFRAHGALWQQCNRITWVPQEARPKTLSLSEPTRAHMESGGSIPSGLPVMETPVVAVDSGSKPSGGAVFNKDSAPNMLKYGGITFNLMHSAYGQSMDGGKVVVERDMIQGTVVAKLPYGPQSPYLNPYAKAWLGLHERYAGDFIYDLHIGGSPQFGGEILICWQPRTYSAAEESNMTMADWQKYTYAIIPFTEVTTQTFVLKDARDYQFYRLVKDSANDKPCLYFVVYNQMQSMFDVGVRVQITIKNRLAPNFQVANPVLPVPAPSMGLTTTPSNIYGLAGKTLGELLPYNGTTDSGYFYMALDGNKMGLIGDPQTPMGTTWQRITHPMLTRSSPMKWEDDYGNMFLGAEFMVWETTLLDTDTKNLPFNFDLPLETREDVITAAERGDLFVDDIRSAVKGSVPLDLLASVKTTGISYYQGLNQLPEVTRHKGYWNIPYTNEGNTAPQVPNEFKHDDEEAPITKYERTRWMFQGYMIQVSYYQVHATLGTTGFKPNELSPSFFYSADCTIPRVPINYFLTTSVADSTDTAPPGWRMLTFTNEQPVVLETGVTYSMPLLVPRYDLLEFFDKNFERVEFQLSHPKTGIAVATVRYEKDFGGFYISPNNTTLTHAICPTSVASLVISNPTTNMGASPIGITRIEDWVDMYNPQSVQMFMDEYNRTRIKFTRTTMISTDVRANAWMGLAGGGLAGLGAGLQDMNNKRWMNEAREDEQAFKKLMAEMGFDFQNMSREDQQAFQQMMQINRQTFELERDELAYDRQMASKYQGNKGVQALAANRSGSIYGGFQRGGDDQDWANFGNKVPQWLVDIPDGLPPGYESQAGELPLKPVSVTRPTSEHSVGPEVPAPYPFRYEPTPTPSESASQVGPAEPSPILAALPKPAIPTEKGQPPEWNVRPGREFSRNWDSDVSSAVRNDPQVIPTPDLAPLTPGYAKP